MITALNVKFWSTILLGDDEYCSMFPRYIVELQIQVLWSWDLASQGSKRNFCGGLWGRSVRIWALFKESNSVGIFFILPLFWFDLECGSLSGSPQILDAFYQECLMNQKYTAVWVRLNGLDIFSFLISHRIYKAISLENHQQTCTVPQMSLCEVPTAQTQMWREQ